MAKKINLTVVIENITVNVCPEIDKDKTKNIMIDELTKALEKAKKVADVSL